MHRWLVICLALAACHKDKSSSSSPTSGPGAPASTAELDALWAKAPDNAMVGFVASPRAIEMMEHAWHDVHAFLKTIPQFAPVDQEMTAELAKIGLAPDFTFADVGIGPAKGGAVFVADDGKAMFAIIPVVDRDKFVAKAKGTKGADFDKFEKNVCKPIDGGFYACADTAELFGRFGKGNLRSGLDVVKARGDLEFVVTQPAKAAGVAQLARGQVVVRGTYSGVPSLLTSKLGAPHGVNVDASHSSGFASIDFRPMLDGVPDVPIVEGVSAAQVVKSIGGPLTVKISAGDFAFEARLPLADTAPAKALIEHCGDLPPALGAKLDGGACRLPVPQMNVDVVASIDGKDLKLASKAGAGSPATVAPSAAAAELAKGAWSAVFWGRGTILAPTPAQGMSPWQQMPDEAATIIRVLAMFNELGIGVRVDGDTLSWVWTLRTGWANPDDVVAKLVAIDPQQVVAGKGAELGKAIADASPGSPFAADYKSGYGGLMVPTAIVGMMAAVAVPAFMSYMSASKRGPMDGEDPGGPVHVEEP
ncbi:MAG: hypothetical protein ACM31C_33345 [Acidobacteriota bacterium]